MKNLSARTGVYLRLSRDDEKAGESASIENQRVILKRFVCEHGGKIAEEYVDDGWSGTSFDRPSVKRMLSDAQSGVIDTIVVKDLSRFGRNYIQVGQYIDYIFPAYGVRFIAVNDNVDTSERGSAAMDMMPIMNVFNEWHAANTSKKIRAVLKASQNAGKYTNSIYPYGYKAGKDANRTAVVDEEAAAVVRRIFGLRAEGKSARAIAKILTDEGIPNPATHFTKLDGGKWNRPCKPYWWASTVADILKNATYAGSTVQHKTTSVSYKNHRTVTLPASERIIKENAHEAIIARELWDRVQEINRSAFRGKADKTNKVHALSGLLVCGDCGRKLKLKTYKSSIRFACRTYTDLGKRYCSSHSLPESEAEELLLSDIRAMLGGAEFDEGRARENYLAYRQKNGACGENRLKACRARLEELDRLIGAAFEEKVLRDMPSDAFANLCEKYKKERAAVVEEIALIGANQAADDGAEEYVKKLKAYGSCETLTRELCLRLVNFIKVGEKNGDGSREIHIYYRLKKD